MVQWFNSGSRFQSAISNVSNLPVKSNVWWKTPISTRISRFRWFVVYTKSLIPLSIANNDPANYRSSSESQSKMSQGSFQVWNEYNPSHSIRNQNKLESLSWTHLTTRALVSWILQLSTLFHHPTSPGNKRKATSRMETIDSRLSYFSQN